MKCRTIQKAKTAMLESGSNWRIPFMEFVDDLPDSPLEGVAKKCDNR